jgi:hypothetical protein
MNTIQRKAGEPLVRPNGYHGFDSLRELEAAYPNGEGGLRLTATEGEGSESNSVVVYFNGNYDSGFMANFIRSFAYVNMWKIEIQPVNYI